MEGFNCNDYFFREEKRLKEKIIKSSLQFIPFYMGNQFIIFIIVYLTYCFVSNAIPSESIIFALFFFCSKQNTLFSELKSHWDGAFS